MLGYMCGCTLHARLLYSLLGQQLPCIKASGQAVTGDAGLCVCLAWDLHALPVRHLLG